MNSQPMVNTWPLIHNHQSVTVSLTISRDERWENITHPIAGI